MSQKVKTPKGVIITLAAGFGLGAITMAGIGSGIAVPKAFAQAPQVSVQPISGVKTENIATLRDLDESFANLAEFVAPSVVDIRATSNRATGPNGARMPVRQGEGSGFIIRSNGYIMTNDHVVGDANQVKVVLKDGREYDGKVIRAEDSSGDLAIVKIEAKDLPSLAFSDSSQLRPGQLCMAVGAPFGLENSVTFGHISALGRVNNIPDASVTQQGRRYADMIQTDASINMGNSGGPLLNIDGQVIGVNTAIYSPSGVSAGIGFAIPSNQAKFIGNMLIEKGKIVRSVIGVYPENLKEYEKKDMSLTGGARIVGFPPETQSASPAKKAGIKEGDIVTKIGTTPINSELDLRNAMLIYAPGTKVPVEVVRAGKRLTLDVALEEYKAPAKPQAQNLQEMPGMDKDEFLKRFPKGFDGREEDVFKEFRKQMEQGGGEGQEPRAGRAQLGVSIGNVTDEIRKSQSIPSGVEGAFISSVQPDSSAANAGLSAGDVITQLGNKKITSADELITEMERVKPGDTKPLKIGRYTKGVSQSLEKSVTFK